MDKVDHPFDPVVDARCHTLILGSFPSVKSRENAFYYGHPQNRFWRMLAAGSRAPRTRRSGTPCPSISRV